MKKFFKTFFKMKYNRLLLFIYKKEFRRLYCHRATAHSVQGEPQQVPITRKNSATGAKKEKETPKKERKKKIKKREKYKASAF